MAFEFIQGHSRGKHSQIVACAEAIFNQEPFVEVPVTSQSLQSLGEALMTTAAERKYHNNLVYCVTDMIQKALTASRFYVAGPYARRVSVGPIQVDLVVFLVNQQRRSIGLSSQPPIFDGEYLNYNKSMETLHSFLKSSKSSLEELSGSKVQIQLHMAYTYATSRAPYRVASPPCIHLIFDNVTCFNIYLTPSLGATPEAQRQACYRHMKTAFETGGLNAVVPWFPGLIERAGEDIAGASATVQSFIRVCSLWAHLIPGIKGSFRSYTFETLALLTLQKLTKDQRSGGRKSDLGVPAITTFDFKQAFRAFLTWCSNLDAVSELSEIYSPSTFFSPWTDYPFPTLTDHYNPYDNLLIGFSDNDIRRIERSARSTLQLMASPPSQGSPHPPREVTLHQVMFAPISKSPGSSKLWIGRLCFALLTFLLVACSAFLMVIFFRADMDGLLETYFDQARVVFSGLLEDFHVLCLSLSAKSKVTMQQLLRAFYNTKGYQFVANKLELFQQ